MQRDPATTSDPINAPLVSSSLRGQERVRDSEPTAITRRRGSPVGRVVMIGLVVALTGWIGVRVKSALENQKAVAETRDQVARTAADKATAPAPVKTVTPQKETWQPRIAVEGTLAPVRESTVGFRVPGRIASIRVKVGDRVTEGQVLASLDSTEAAGQVTAAEAQLRAAQAQLALATDAERRTASMVERGALPEAQGVQLQNEKALAAANVDGAKARLDLARVHLGNHTVKAPFAGVVTKAPTGVGGVAVGGGQEFHVSDLTSLKLVGSIGETDASLVQLGQVVEIATDRGPVAGKISSVLAQVDAATRRVPIEATVDNKGPTPLLANTFVRATVVGGAPIEVLRLPRAVLRPGSQDEVFVVKDDVLAARRIRFLAQPDGTILVRSGIDVGEQLLLNPTPESKDGDRVAIDNTPSAKGAER